MGQTLWGTSGGTVRRWKLGTGTIKSTYSGLSFSNRVFSSNRNSLALGYAGAVWLLDLETEMRSGAVICDPLAKDKRAIVIAPSGHYKISPTSGESDLRYIAKTDSGEQLTLTPTEFTEKYGWKNDPSQVNLLDAN